MGNEAILRVLIGTQPTIQSSIPCHATARAKKMSCFLTSDHGGGGLLRPQRHQQTLPLRLPSRDPPRLDSHKERREGCPTGRNRRRTPRRSFRSWRSRRPRRGCLLSGIPRWWPSARSCHHDCQFRWMTAGEYFSVIIPSRSRLTAFTSYYTFK